MNRLVVASISLCVGIVVAATDQAISPVRWGHGPNVDPAGLMFCVTMYGVAYAVGRRLYRWQGASDDLRALEGHSRRHMAVLNAVGGAVLLVTWSEDGPRFQWRVATAVGVLMMAGAVQEVLRMRRPPR